MECFAIAGKEPDWDGFEKIEELASRTTKLSKGVGSVARIIRAAGKQNRSAILDEPSAKNIQDANLLLQIVFGATWSHSSAREGG